MEALILHLSLMEDALKGQTLVVFEDVLYEDVSVGSHEDINDTDQSIYFPNIGTTATDKADGDHSITAAKQVTIVDKVEYKNLAPGEKHHVKGTLMDKATGKALMVNGRKLLQKQNLPRINQKDQ